MAMTADSSNVSPASSRALRVTRIGSFAKAFGSVFSRPLRISRRM
jgi:hypothetical protein